MMRRCFLLTFVWIVACHRAPDRMRFQGAPVILISIDTLRSDHLPAYGYDKVETPNLDRFRRHAILFRHAYSHCPMTLPSHISMLTGLLPPEHGVRDNVGFRFDARAHRNLPSIVRSQGYATGAAVSSVVLRGEAGLAAMFDFYDDAIEARPGAAFREYQRSGKITESIAERWIDAHASQPFFFFFHIYEPHVPYDPPEPFRSRYSNAYDGEIAASDAIVGSLLQHLQAKGLYDKAIVIVTSDHGEGLGDHGEDQHSILVYREAIQVPLMLKLPGAKLAGREAAAPAQLIDIAPTILDLLGIEKAPTSLLTIVDTPPRSRDIYSESLYPRYHFGWSELRSIINDRWHYIDAPRPELYDLRADPAERSDLAMSERREVKQMRDALAKFGRGIPPVGDVDPETAAKMTALGYIGSARNRGSGPLPNPRDEIERLGEMRSAIELAAAGRTDEAARIFRAIVAKSPEFIEAWTQLADAMALAGRLAEAASAYREAMARSNGFSADLALSLADVDLQQGKLDEATRLAQASTEWSPRRAHELLARVALSRRDLAAAEQHARAIADAPNAHPTDLVLLGEVAAAREKYGEALQVLDKAERAAAEREISAVYRLDFVRGDVLARLGRPAAAIDAYRREIARFPHDERAYTNLAVLYFVTGNRAAVEPTLKEMIAANRTPRARELAERTRSSLR